MKFGETLFQRSVPKWAPYNLNYNALKHTIKLRTTTGAPSPVPIPGQSVHRWSLLEDELYVTLKEQYDHITLFLRSKHGELERRLAFLDKSVRSAKRSASLNSGRPSMLARKYQKLVQDAESIGEDIQALSRFAAVQKTAFRKILKKYRKWTNSDSLRLRLETEVFSDGQLDIDVSDQMQHLAAQRLIIKNLEDSLLNPDDRPRERRGSCFNTESPASRIAKAAQLGPLHFDTSLACVPYGEASGIATYWIHVDNLSEARVLLLRYMREVELQPSISRESSNDSLSSARKRSRSNATNVAYFDNAQRYMQDPSVHSPAKTALSARWSHSKQALVTMSDMLPRSDNTSTVTIKRKELGAALDRNCSAPQANSANAANVNIVKEFLSQHRDIKPLAMLRSTRSRYLGLNNSAEAGTFAALDTDIVVAPFDPEKITAPDEQLTGRHTFPHAVLEIRWEFGRKPEVIREFDNTHLAERISNFSLERAAICIQNPELGSVPWASLLDKDIRKVPVQARVSKRNEVMTGSSSAPSSTDGPADSVFSAPLRRPSGGSDTSPMASTQNLPASAAVEKPKQKKKARIVAENPRRPSVRYYSEYDDPESELYQQEAYTIYVDPDQEAPGMATIRKIGSTFSGALSWALAGKSRRDREPNEQTSLLRGSDSSQEEDESDDESEDTYAIYKGPRGQRDSGAIRNVRLSRRQRAHERTLTLFYSGLLVLSYFFLLMSAILLTTGRKKEVLEVDIGATVGVIMAFICMFVSCAVVYLRTTKLTSVEWISLFLADGMIVVLGAAVIVGIVERATTLK